MTIPNIDKALKIQKATKALNIHGTLGMHKTYQELNMREVLIQLPTDDTYSGLSSAQEIQLNPQLLSRLTGTYSYDQVKLPFLLSKCASLASGTLHLIGPPAQISALVLFLATLSGGRR